jgi:site-specific DNA recombinase
MKEVKIGLYARVSSDKQAQEKTIDSQIAAILDFAATSGESIDPDLHFIDNGVSGASLERPGLDRLRDKAISAELSRVYILSPDRLARKSAHQMLLIEEMKRLHVDVIFANRPIGDSPEDQMLLQIQGIVSEYEREKILERSRRGKLHAAKKGKINVLSGAPFGYVYLKADKDRDAAYQIHPEESLVVKEAFRLYALEHLSIGEIAKRFTKAHYKTRTGITFWERSVIWGMLRNPAYKGTAAFRKTIRVQRIRKTKLAIESQKRPRSMLSSPRDRPSEERIYIAVPAIVDEKIFSLAEQQLKKNVSLSPRNNKKYEYLLSGILRCKTCGYAIYGKPTSNSKYKRLYYRCTGQDGYRWSKGRVCVGHPVRVEAIDDLVWSSVKNLILDPEATIQEYQRRVEMASSNPSIALIEQKEKEVKRLTSEKSRILDIYQAGLIDKGEIECRLKSLRSRLEQLLGEISFLEKQKNEREKMLTLVKNLDEFIVQIRNKVDVLSFRERQKIVRLLVEQVEVDSVNETLNIKHVIPIMSGTSEKYPLCPGSDKSIVIEPISALYI